jgi:hypothetical protein
MAENRAQRRLAAFLAADVVGYSRLMAGMTTVSGVIDVPGFLRGCARAYETFHASTS